MSTSPKPNRKYKCFMCAKCERMNPDYLTFQSKGKYYCLNHAPKEWRDYFRDYALWIIGGFFLAYCALCIYLAATHK